MVHYCVMWLANGAIAYQGFNGTLAAIAFDPGTVCGKGMDGFDAHRKATLIRQKINNTNARIGKKK